MTMSPPLPPSPPEGPPRATNFSRRNAMHPFPPSPALTRIFASSINMSLVVSCWSLAKPVSPVSSVVNLLNHGGGSENQKASSRRRGYVTRALPRREPSDEKLVDLYRFDHHELAHLPLVQELDAPRDLGKESVVFAAPDV